MKKFIAAGIIIAGLIIGVLCIGGTLNGPVRAEADYLRIHVRANSNEQLDQSVKYIVKDEVVKFITPYAAQCVDKITAIELIEGILPQIEEVCDKTLKEQIGRAHV